MLLDLRDPQTNQIVRSWEYPQDDALQMRYGLDLADALPTEALSRTWDTTSLEASLGRILDNLDTTTASDGNVEDRASLADLMSFLEEGRREGYLLDNSCYPVGTALAAGEPSVMTTNAFVSGPAKAGDLVPGVPGQEVLSPAILQQSPPPETPEKETMAEENQAASPETETNLVFPIVSPSVDEA